MSNKILIVEDDANIAKLIEYNLVKAGFKVSLCDNGDTAIKKIEKGEYYDLVVLDIMLPVLDGLSVCKRIRSNQKLNSTKILMLTAKGEEVDKILGFEFGADDYVVKPFSPRELVLRVKALLRRNEVSEDVLVCDDLKIDVNNYTTEIKNEKINLTAMEFKLLVVLMRNKGNVQTRDFLLEEVWDTSSEVTTRTIDTHVKKLRQKLGKYGDRIETVRSVGYRFIG